MLACVAVMVLPIAITILGSFGINMGVESAISFQGYLDFYVWKPLYIKAYVRSILIAGSAMLGTLIIAVPAAYIFAKASFKGKSLIFYIYIIVMMMPFQVTLLPQYIIARRIGTYNSLLAMILPGIFAPFSVFLLTQIVKSIPWDILDAARIDTSSTLIILSRIIVPIIRPGIVCSGVLTFTEQWNMVAEPLVLLDAAEKYPLAVLLSYAAEISPLSYAATAMFFMLPLLMFAIYENEIAEGLGEYRLK